MEKLTGNKHNHLFTDLIKVCIFGLMLLLPFLCFLPTGFYYGFNEHATNTETTTINYKYESNEVTKIGDLVEGNIYRFNYNGYGDEFAKPMANDLRLIKVYQYNFTNCDFDLDEVFWSSILNDNDIDVYFSFDTGLDANFTITLNHDESLFSYYGTIDCEFILNAEVQITYLYNTAETSEDNANIPYSYTDYNVIESVSVNTDDTISNKMYKAWEGVWTSPLFNWTNTTPLNSGLNGFISIFGINQNSYIANCLIYLLSITAIYVVFDIVLSMFKWLTHLINK